MMSKTFHDYLLAEPEEFRLVPKPNTPVPKQRRRKEVTIAPKLLPTTQAAKYLSMSEWKLRRLAHDGEIPVIKGKYWKFDVTDLDQFIARHREKLL